MLIVLLINFVLAEETPGCLEGLYCLLSALGQLVLVGGSGQGLFDDAVGQVELLLFVLGYYLLQVALLLLEFLLEKFLEKIVLLLPVLFLQVDLLGDQLLEGLLLGYDVVLALLKILFLSLYVCLEFVEVGVELLKKSLVLFFAVFDLLAD